MFRIPQGGVAQIDRHGQCRRVKNNQSENPVMIPVGGPGQWSAGTNSFLLSDTVATLVGPCHVFQVVWLLDASGSMMSRKMSRAQDLIIDALTEAEGSTIPYPYLRNAAPVAGDYLYSFNDNAVNRGGARRGDAAAVNQLKDRVRSVSGNGNTDITRALRQVFAAAAAGGMNTGINKTIVILVSDGITSNPNIDEVMRQNEHLGIPVYAFDIEPPVDSIMQRIDTYSGTTYSKDDINAVLEQIFRNRSNQIDAATLR